MSEESQGTILMLLFTSGSSFISTFLIIIYYLIRRSLFSSFSFDLVLMLCISDFFFSSANFFRSIWMLVDSNAKINQVACYLIGIHVQTWMFSSFICTSSIQYSIYQKVIQKEQMHKKSAFKRFWIVNYLVPFISGIILYASGSIGHIGPFKSTFCFINTGNKAKTELMMVIFYYIPYLAILLYNSVVIGCLINHYRKLKEQYANLTQQEYLKLLAYPIILFVCFFPVILARILSNFGIENDTFLRISYCVDNLIGFFNALIYFLFSLNPCQIDRFQRLKSLNYNQNKLNLSQQKLGQNDFFINQEQQMKENLISSHTNIIQNTLSQNKQSELNSEQQEWTL